MTESNRARRPTVVLVGGGYGGIAVAKALDETSDVVLVEPKDAFMHNIAALRAPVNPSWLPAIFLPYASLLTNGRVLGVERLRERFGLTTRAAASPSRSISHR
jgi:NADH dehydrogenase FAD-containing subunit